MNTLKEKSVKHNKEYCPLDKTTEREVCFPESKVWREHKSLPLPVDFQRGLCTEPVFLSLTVLIFSTFDLRSAVISLLFTFTITHSNLIKFKTLNTCSSPRVTVLLPPTLASRPLRLIESSWTEATGNQQEASRSRRVLPTGQEAWAPLSALFSTANLGSFLPPGCRLSASSCLFCNFYNLPMGKYKNCNLQHLQMVQIKCKIGACLSARFC